MREEKQLRSEQVTGGHGGKLQKRKSDPFKLTLKLLFSQHLPLIHCQVTRIVPRDTLANGFCGAPLTHDCADSQAVQDANKCVTHPGVHTGQMLAPFLPRLGYPKYGKQGVMEPTKESKKCLCVLPQCPLNYCLVKRASVLAGPDSTESREQFFSKHLFCDLATFYWKCQPE